MKLLVFSHDNCLSGATKAVFDFTNELRKHNYEIVYVIPDKGELEDALIKGKYKYLIIPNPQWTIYAKESNYSRWYYFKYYIQNMLLFLKSMLYSHRKSIEEVKNINPDIIFVNTSVAPLGLYVAKQMKIRSALWVHEAICDYKGACGATLFSRKYVGKMLNNANWVFGPSNFIKGYVEDLFAVSKMHILPNAIAFTQNFQNVSSAYKFGLVGSIHKAKGQIEFFASMIKNMPEAKLIVFGSGTNNYAKELSEIADSHPNNIKLYGYESDLNKIYSSFEIYVNMGVNETFGRTTVEAMRAGKLVFGRRSGATPEIIKHGENGFLFDNVDEIFAILKEYDTTSGNMRLQKIREQGRLDSLKYTPDKIIAVFNGILAKGEE